MAFQEPLNFIKRDIRVTVRELLQTNKVFPVLYRSNYTFHILFNLLQADV